MLCVRSVVVGLMVGSLLLTPVPVRADGANPATAPAPTQPTNTTPVTPPPAPPSALNLMGIFKWIFSFADVTDGQNWVVYGAVGTGYLIKKFWAAWATAKAARAAMLLELDKMEVAHGVKDKLLAEVDAQIKILEERLPHAAPAALELDKHIRNIGNRKRRPLVKDNYNGLADIQKLETWLASPDAQRFLENPSGKNWKATYDGLKAKATTDIDEPLSIILKKANAVYTGETFHPIHSAQMERGGKPGEFVVRNDFTHSEKPVSLSEIGRLVGNIRNRCLEPLQASSAEMGQLKNDAKWRVFWTRPKNFSWPLTYAILSTAGGLSTFWIHSAVDYDRRQAELAAQARQKADAATDLAGTLTTPEGREKMKSYYQNVRDVLKEHRERMVPMIMAMLELDPNKKESREKALKFIDETLDSEAFGVALEQATIHSAKDKQGDRVTKEALLQMIDNAKKDKGVREGLFRPFNKEVIKGLINNLWSDRSVNDPSEDFDKAVLGSILRRIEAVLANDPTIQPPPAQLVPPAPGVMPAAPKGNADNRGQAPAAGAKLVPPATDTVPLSLQGDNSTKIMPGAVPVVKSEGGTMGGALGRAP